MNNASGDAELWDRLAISGEPVIPALKEWFFDAPEPQIPLLDFYGLSLKLDAYRAEYHNYWETSATATATGEYCAL